MKILESKFVILTIFITGILFGALFGFWTSIGMIIASELAVMAYRYYMSGKLKETVVDESVNAQSV